MRSKTAPEAAGKPAKKTFKMEVLRPPRSAVLSLASRLSNPRVQSADQSIISSVNK